MWAFVYAAAAFIGCVTLAIVIGFALRPTNKQRYLDLPSLGRVVLIAGIPHQWTGAYWQPIYTVPVIFPEPQFGQPVTPNEESNEPCQSVKGLPLIIRRRSTKTGQSGSRFVMDYNVSKTNGRLD